MQQAADFPQELLDLYDHYAHGLIDRRTFIQRAAQYTTAGMTAAALLQALSPHYARAQQVAADDARIHSERVSYLHTHPSCNGRVGVVGFCFGGAVANALAIALPDVIRAAVPFYGMQPAAADVPKIKASLLVHYAEFDGRVNAGWPDYQAALDAHGIDYAVHFYPGVNHGFHNDSTPRYNAAAARLAWDRTIAFFREQLGA
jgi:carboxymethylenebutenolidase